MTKQKMIDVSEHNGDITWDKVKEQGYHAIIRLGWFGNQDYAIDKKFTRNLNACINRKIPFGIYVYSYAKSSVRGVDMANWVHRQIANINVPYGIFIDLEEPGTLDYALRVNNAFYDRMKQLRYPIVGFYASLSWYDAKLRNAKRDRFWLAQWSSSANASCDIWQYTSDGHISGMPSKRFDMNWCYYKPNDTNTVTKPKETALSIDGLWGKKTTAKLQEVLGTPQDGIVSHQSIKYKAKNPGLLSSSWNWETSSRPKGSTMIRALQKKLNVTQDGLFGPITCKALQRYLGTVQDGYISNPSQCVKALQKALNNNKF